ELRDPVGVGTEEIHGFVGGATDRGMARRVPSVIFGASEAEVTRIIDKANAPSYEIPCVDLGHTIRGGKDDHLAISADSDRIWGLHEHVTAPRQVRINLVDPPPGVVAGNYR